ncbi:hypothetical protein Sste5346_009012 [Sporothrix stenoceras]|uniref:Uncharacterized protein n=1 Tax=Sporothrix stenoceras TaxID=5173 RepID=A0ABR3YN13_9PEZI
MIQRLAVGLLCLASAAVADVNTDVSGLSSDSHVFDIKLRQNSHPPLRLSHSSLSLVDASVGANATAPWTAGSVCTEEGEWNCLTTCWQRCASGVWSDTMALAEGTVCAPVGLSYDITLSPSTGEVKTSANEDISTVLAATTGLCQCTAGGCTASTSPSSSSSSTTEPSTTTASSSRESSTGDFIPGSTSPAATQPASTVTVVVGVGMLAVVFARLLM